VNAVSFSVADIFRAADLLAGHRIAIITGAGISTESGIPDYRGEGAPARTPMTHERFLAQDDADRRRYWAGGELGWKDFSTRSPNAGHRAVARLESEGLATGVVTQNVDGLHQAAGSRRVVELHGTGRRVRCLNCGQIFDRRAVSARILRDNPSFGVSTTVTLGPDGDAVPADTTDFVVPDCTVCGGLLRPDVVFFGEFVPGETFRLAEGIVAAADAVLVAGSSLVVNSATRLLERARRRDLPLVIVNRGATRWDHRATLKLDGATGEVLPALAQALLD
jgi:NAD-dependent SIR2 family protein deacetylase